MGNSQSNNARNNRIIHPARTSHSSRLTLIRTLRIPNPFDDDIQALETIFTPKAHSSSTLSLCRDEPPTSPSTTTFSKNSQPTQLPCSPPSHLAYYSPPISDGRKASLDSAAEAAFDIFLKQFPQYRLTWILDTLRRTDYTRLLRTSSQRASETETYVDYMGGSLYPESLIRVHTEFLAGNVLGNTHSISASSQLSLKHAEEARRAVLEFFGAPTSTSSSHDDDSDEYTVIFTPNASGALKLVGEAFQFSEGSSFVLGVDSHNSVNGIREFARRGGAKVVYVPASGKKGDEGAFDLNEAKNILKRNRPPPNTPSLYALTGLSNITNAKCPALYSSSSSKEDGSIITYARNLGYNTLLDAAALAPTTRISLAEMPVDALAVSFYKMFGFPTGVGALVVRKGFLRMLRSGRPWFAGGTVDVVQVPGKVRTMKGVGEEFEGFEDGTINYLPPPCYHLRAAPPLCLPPIPASPSQLSLASSCYGARQNPPSGSGWADDHFLSRIPKKVLKGVGETDEDAGAVVACIFLDPGETLPLSFIAYSAAQEGISLRTGCMCNPGGAAALLGIQETMKDVEEGGMMREGMTLREFEQEVERERQRRGIYQNQRVEQGLGGRTELGVVRISLGLGTDWSDLWRVLQWVKKVGNARERKVMWRRWIGTTTSEAHAQAELDDDDEWREEEGGAIRRREAVAACVPCKSPGTEINVSLVEEEEGWDTMIGRAI
ncbi:PLP-dependent transferase [Gymnopus androsaceus JB14]|uniref:PLP-dependent transferase n=1 Tax=Gymnopus androsaceus JB14 TaxID=1447944 RepID=A0A6A4HYG3_9AGAR|nr:PLP-dependent transferase [Gymnopus androsaceus JB14]